ncbi:MAG TPA: thiosulfate oxidation carrier protein SoxY, partial [Gammaproteobacteria bacterium]|nr:thiosulfate oxidation carrier protein SoxY [Gammaproteobacteria bacterium]
MKRRLFLKSAMAGSAVATAVGAGLLTPSMVF